MKQIKPEIYTEAQIFSVGNNTIQMPMNHKCFAIQAALVHTEELEKVFKSGKYRIVIEVKE